MDNLSLREMGMVTMSIAMAEAETEKELLEAGASFKTAIAMLEEEATESELNDFRQMAKDSVEIVIERLQELKEKLNEQK